MVTGTRAGANPRNKLRVLALLLQDSISTDIVSADD
jgi:hypothetical protein